MKNEQMVLFENEEVKIKTDEGITLINLVHTAKCCGLCKTAKSGNIVVTWKDRNGLVDKLTKIREANASQEFVDEINYIIDEIENTDDRNSIYMSSKLSRRLAMECKSQKAMEYKDFLAKLDESYSKGELTTNNPYLQLGNIADNMKLMSNMMNQIGQAFNGMQEYVQSSIQAKDLQIDQVKELIGFKNINTKRMVNEIKSKLSEKLGKKIYANHNDFQIIKHAIFKEFRTTTWENIPIEKYNSVYAFADELISEKYGKVY